MPDVLAAITVKKLAALESHESRKQNQSNVKILNNSDQKCEFGPNICRLQRTVGVRPGRTGMKSIFRPTTYRDFSMLVLSRRAGESFCISDDIVVTITEIRGNKVRLAFGAPRSCSIARGEIAGRERSKQSSVPKPPDQSTMLLRAV